MGGACRQTGWRNEDKRGYNSGMTFDGFVPIAVEGDGERDEPGSPTL
jgi:hypothetical protein